MARYRCCFGWFEQSGFLLFGAVIWASLAGATEAGELPGAAAFLKAHCLDCHAGETKEGGLDLQTLDGNLADRGLFAKWERIHDRVAAGEMPPKSAERPAAAEQAAFLAALSGQLTTAHAAQKGTVLRRLNRREYENTINDLFGVHLKLALLLPADSKSHEFDNVGEALGVSTVQLQRYLECAELALDEAIAKRIAPPEVKKTRVSYAETRGGEQWLNKIWLHRDDGAVVFFKQYGYPGGMLREANMPQDGWYNIRITGYAYQSEQPITFSVGAQTFARGLEQPTFGYYSLPPGPPSTVELKAWLPARYMVDILPWGIGDKNNEIRNNGVKEYKGPGLAIQHVEIEGPLVEEFPSKGHQLVFDGLNRREIMPRNPADRQRSSYVPKFEIASADAPAEITPVLQRVATKAFRRPVAAEQIAPYRELFQAEVAGGATLEEGLRAAVAAILCSPEFLYFQERPRGATADEPGAPPSTFWLDDFSLAARLSYFLTRSTPDDELLAAAAGGKLAGDRAVLLAHTERLLKHPHAGRFVADFTDAWLNLREIEFTNPDGALFPEFDRFLQHAMVDESRAYFRKLVDDNLGVSHLVKADFAMLNNRLAEHYGVEGVSGPEIRPVKLPPGSLRGGFLTQGAVLKVSANGTNTSPVVRGVWVMERILGQPPQPPPPGIPGVEPDIRGASTLRELLDKHRNVDTCRGCHQQIDPPGFALESFDPIGGYRERFRGLGQGEKVNLEIRGQRVRYTLGLPVDASGELPSGEKFAGFAEFRDLLAQDPDRLARAFAGKLLTFGTGRELGFSDRAELSRLVAESRKSSHGLRDLVKLVVTSEIFRRK